MKSLYFWMITATAAGALVTAITRINVLEILICWIISMGTWFWFRRVRKEAGRR